MAISSYLIMRFAAFKQCKEEGVMFFGALAASIVVAFYVVKHGDKEPVMAHNGSLFKPVAYLASNIRDRVQHPISKDQVGCYMSVKGIDVLSKVGVKHDVDAQLESFTMPFQLLLLDGHVNTKTQPKFFQDIPISRSITSDLSILSVGKYSHKPVHSMKRPGGQLAELSIASVHLSLPLPHCGRVVGMYVSSIDLLCYSMMYKYEERVANKLFAAFTAAVEQIDQVAASETMSEDVDRVRK